MREQFAMRCIIDALARIDMSWSEWVVARDSGHYVPWVKFIPVLRRPSRRHLLAWLMSKN